MNGSQALGRVQTARSGPVQPQGPGGWEGWVTEGRMRCGAPFSAPRSPREPCHPEGAFKWSSNWGFALQDCLRGGWAGYSFGPPARPVFGPWPASPVIPFLGSGWTVSRARSGPRIRYFSVLDGGVNPAGMGLSSGTPGVVNPGPGRTIAGMRIRQSSGLLSTVLAGPPPGLRALPERIIFLNRNGAQKGGFGTGEITASKAVWCKVPVGPGCEFRGPDFAPDRESG